MPTIHKLVGFRQDTHRPRGYRELRSPAEMRKLLNRKIRQQAGICALGHEEFTDYHDIVPDHKNANGMGGASSSLVNFRFADNT